MDLLTKVIVLVIMMTVVGCATPADKLKFDRQENGYFVEKMSSGFPLGTPPGVYPGPVVAIANEKLEKKIRETTGDYFSECFIAPRVGGYDVVIVTRERLSKSESDAVYKYVEVALGEAVKEGEQYQRENQPIPEGSVERSRHRTLDEPRKASPRG